MSNKKRAERREALAAAEGGRRRSRPETMVVAIATVGAVIGIGWWFLGDHAAEPTVSPALVEDKTGAEVAPIDYFGKLPGRWERADGGYIIDIKSVEGTPSLFHSPSTVTNLLQLGGAITPGLSVL